MAHKCEKGCGKWIADNKRYCNSCEKTIYGNKGAVDEEEKAKTDKSSHSILQDT